MKIILVSHGDFAKGIHNSVQMVAGQQEELYAFGIYPEEDKEALAERIRKVLDSRQENEEILILSDLFHGTPFNVCVELSEHYEFQHVTGINLGLLILALMDRIMGKNVKEISEHILQESVNTVKDVNKMLECSGEDDEEEEE